MSRAREQKITELSQHFANDDLTLDDLERRIERVYKASNVVELDEITADLRQAMMPAPPIKASRMSLGRSRPSVPANYEIENVRVLSLMSSTKRVGRWAVPRKLDVLAIMSDTKIDLTQAALPPGMIEIDLRLVMAAFKLIVPPNVRVINEMHSVMADVRSKADQFDLDALDAAEGSATVIRLTGYAVMAEAKVIVRRREEPVYDDDDDEES